MGHNPHYERASDEGRLSNSVTNSNVTFKERKDFSHIGGFSYGSHEKSPIDSTTEL